MEYRKLYQNQLKENQDLKTQINILETILRNYIPVIEKNDENLNGQSKLARRN